jgi:hypothetical protein
VDSTHIYILQGKEPKPLAWMIAACSEWLSKNKIPSNEEFKDELRFVKLELIKDQTHVTTMVLLEKEQAESVNISKTGVIKFLFCACITYSWTRT